MDSYVDLFQFQGAALITLAKGNRSQQVTDACKKYGGFYLGSIGGPAAILAKENIKKVEVLEYPELGMEAVWKIEAEDFPAFILVDDKGNDFFKQILQLAGHTSPQRILFSRQDAKKGFFVVSTLSARLRVNSGRNPSYIPRVCSG